MSHYFEYRKEFIFTLKGPGVSEKIRSFPALYEEYVKEYCTFTG
jgi:hypothetical protein